MIEYSPNLEIKELFDSKVGLDESCFSRFRQGKHGHGTGGKTAVFGLLKRNDRQ